MTKDLNPKMLVVFIKTYLSIIRRYYSVLTPKRKMDLPDFFKNSYQIIIHNCEEAVAIEFKKEISKKQNSYKISKHKSLNQIFSQLIGNNPAILVDGKEATVVSNFAITTKSCHPFVKSTGQLQVIPDGIGITRVINGGDIFFDNVSYFYLDKNEKPRQIIFKGLWIIAKDAPLLSEKTISQKRAVTDFFQHLVSKQPILGEKMKRYSEIDLFGELEKIEIKYSHLVNSDKITEQELQTFLEKHPFILSPTYLNICPKMINISPQMEFKNIGRRVDFILIKEPDINNYTIKPLIIELKKPEDKLFTSNGGYSNQLKIAINQIKSIFDFANSNPKEAYELLEITNPAEILGIILIGRRKDLTTEELKRLSMINKSNKLMKILLFDELFTNIKIVSQLLGKKYKNPVVTVGQKGDSCEDFTGTSSDTIKKAMHYLAKRRQEGW